MVQIFFLFLGIFYCSLLLGQLVYKNDGDSVVVGDVIGFIEVMKFFYEVKLEVVGFNICFLVDNEELVMVGVFLVDFD